MLNGRRSMMFGYTGMISSLEIIRGVGTRIGLSSGKNILLKKTYFLHPSLPIWGSSVRFTPHTLPLHSVFTAHNTHSHVGFYGGRKTGEPGEKPSWHRREQHIKQTQLTYDPAQLEPGTIEVRGEWTNRYATHATHPGRDKHNHIFTYS